MKKDEIQTIKKILEKLGPDQLVEIRRLVDQLLELASRAPRGDGHPDPLEKVIGTCPGLEDLADVHDRYIYDG